MANKKHQKSCGRKPKTKPYGRGNGDGWCHSCDKNLIPKVIKGSERQKAKRLIKKAVNES